MLVLPFKAGLLYSNDDLLHYLHRFIDVEKRHNQTEFISAQTGQYIRLAHMHFYYRTYLPQQYIARSIAAGFVHNSELIDIKVCQHMLRVGTIVFSNEVFKPLFKSATIEKSSESIMTTFVTEFAPQFAVFRNVLQYDDIADILGFHVDHWRSRKFQFNNIPPGVVKKHRIQHGFPGQ